MQKYIWRMAYGVWRMAYGVIRYALERLSSIKHAGIIELSFESHLVASTLWLRVKITLYGIDDLWLDKYGNKNIDTEQEN